MTAKILFIVTLIFQALGLTTLNAQLSPDPLQVSTNRNFTRSLTFVYFTHAVFTGMPLHKNEQENQLMEISVDK